MENSYIIVGPIVLSSISILSFIIGMIFMRLCLWKWKRIKVEYISASGPQFRFSADDSSEINAKMKKLHPKYKYILSIDCIRKLSCRMDSNWDERVYEVKYI